MDLEIIEDDNDLVQLSLIQEVKTNKISHQDSQTQEVNNPMKN